MVWDSVSLIIFDSVCFQEFLYKITAVLDLCLKKLILSHICDFIAPTHLESPQ